MQHVSTIPCSTCKYRYSKPVTGVVTIPTWGGMVNIPAGMFTIPTWGGMVNIPVGMFTIPTWGGMVNIPVGMFTIPTWGGMVNIPVTCFFPRLLASDNTSIHIVYVLYR